MRIWSNGCYDSLHPGHIDLLKYAKSLGGELIVGIDSDEKVKRDKGQNRPYYCQEDRKKMLISLKFVDEVLIFNSTEELEDLIRIKSPDIMVIGSDYKDKPVVGSKYAKKVVFFDRIPGYSTTNILNGVKPK